MKQNGEMNRLGKGRGSESVREAGKVKIFQTLTESECVDPTDGGGGVWRMGLC